MSEEANMDASTEEHSIEESSETEVSELDLTSDTEFKSQEPREPFEKAEFNPKEWDLVEEDNCLIELHGVTRKNLLKSCDKDRVKIIGLFEPDGKTFLQLDDVVFVGEPSGTFGTNVIFEEIETEELSSDDENTFKTTITNANQSGRKTKLEYLTHTDKKLSMYRALLVKKDQQTTTSSAKHAS